jgi:hypothetical protein
MFFVVDGLLPHITPVTRRARLPPLAGAGKPEKIVDKMVAGRLDKYYGEVCLLEQTFIMDGELKVRWSAAAGKLSQRSCWCASLLELLRTVLVYAGCYCGRARTRLLCRLLAGRRWQIMVCCIARRRCFPPGLLGLPGVRAVPMVDLRFAGCACRSKTCWHRPARSWGQSCG